MCAARNWWIPSYFVNIDVNLFHSSKKKEKEKKSSMLLNDTSKPLTALWEHVALLMLLKTRNCACAFENDIKKAAAEREQFKMLYGATRLRFATSGAHTSPRARVSPVCFRCPLSSALCWRWPATSCASLQPHSKQISTGICKNPSM